MSKNVFTSKLRRRACRPSVGATIALAAVVALGGIGYAAIPSQGGELRACYAKANGLLLGIPYSKGDVRLVNEGEACRSYETLVTWNQQGTPGANGTNGVSGYEIVSTQSARRALPLSITDGSVWADCPAGKKVLGGGGRVELYNASGQVGVGLAPAISGPDILGEAWRVAINQAATGGATQAVVFVDAICASVG